MVINYIHYHVCACCSILLKLHDSHTEKNTSHSDLFLAAPFHEMDSFFCRVYKS